MKIKPEQLLTEPIGVSVQTEEQMETIVHFFPQLFQKNRSTDSKLYLEFAERVLNLKQVPYMYLCQQNRYNGNEVSWCNSAAIKEDTCEYYTFTHILFEDIDWCRCSIKIPFIL